MKNGITFADVGWTALRMLCYIAPWLAYVLVVQKEIKIEDVASILMIAACWFAWVNHTRMNRVFKAMEKKESGNG